MQLRILTLAAGAAFLVSVAFGQPVPAKQFFNDASQPQAEAKKEPCNSPSGARFNLEPRSNAAAQNQPNGDFLLDRAGPNDDLIVQVANDYRGNLPSAHWDQSVSGYYVHRSSTADCSTQFEGGLPTTTSQGVTFTGVGSAVVAADPARDAFFVADERQQTASTAAGIGLFRASAATLLDPKACPTGTHTNAEATSCWESTPPALILPGDGFPQLAVDERSTGAGTGAGDVYVLAFGSDSQFNNVFFLLACTNSLNCGSTVSIPGPTTPTGLEYMRVRGDGLITVSFTNVNADGSDDIYFLTCTPAGAPAPPACAAPTAVQHVTVPINSSFDPLFPLVNINKILFTYPKHASRAETGGKFTTFLVYDDCRNPFQFQKPPVTICVDAEVLVMTSTDNGNTWSSPISVDTNPGHHFFPAIATDSSTGIVNIAYYSTEGDSFNHEVGVVRNQILPGTTSPGTPQAMTTVLTAIDLPPQNVNQDQSDFYLGVAVRGNGASGQSHMYTSFESTFVPGTYHGRPLPEMNNHIVGISY